MSRIAILGGGISGLTAAYELELARRRGAAIDWHLYEATNRLGGIVETTRHTTPDGDFILEGGPDAWVSEKPWARELALELGLEHDLIYSNDATRRTYILVDGKLQPIPDRMRLMVPEDLSTLDHSPLFSEAAKQAYALELTRADELKAQAPDHDESVASFALRHFGEEVLTTLAAPLLNGIFGGDVAKLSVGAVMPQFVAIERERGSLILALQQHQAERDALPRQPIFTSLRSGLGCFTAALIAQLPPDRLHLERAAKSLKRERNLWCLRTAATTPAQLARVSKKHFNHIFLATPVDPTRNLLQPIAPDADAFLPAAASSAVLATLCWPAKTARTFTIPSGFGFLVPQSHCDSSCPEQSVISTEASTLSSVISTEAQRSGETCSFPAPEPPLLACTFVDQKFPHRCPPGARVLRVFFGGPGADALTEKSNEQIAASALIQLQTILGPLAAPDSTLTTVRRWPRSLPQYEVGHPERMAQLDALVTRIGNLRLLGNSYHGVGLPDLIHSARATARAIISTL